MERWSVLVFVSSEGFLEPKKSLSRRRFMKQPNKSRRCLRFKATLEEKGPCYSVFRGTDGKQFVIGHSGKHAGGGAISRNAGGGQAYELPRTFLGYQKR